MEERSTIQCTHILKAREQCDLYVFLKCYLYDFIK